MTLHTGEKMMLLRTLEGGRRIQQAPSWIGNSLSPAVASKLAGLETSVIATEGADGYPQIEVLVAPRGFLRCEEDGSKLRIDRGAAAVPYELGAGQHCALLAILDAPRACLRLSGHVAETADSAILVKIAQQFSADGPYLPQWERRPADYVAPSIAADPQMREDLDEEMRAFLADADLLTVASRTPSLDAGEGAGLDVSLRAGLPGFVQHIHSEGFTWPEYPGSKHFSTLGNLLLDARCTLLATAAGKHEALELSGHAEIAWKNPIAQETGSEYAVQFRVCKARFVPDRFAAIYRLRNYAPDLLDMPLQPPPPRRLQIGRRVSETREAISLYLQDCQQRPLRPLLAGQHLTFMLPDGSERDYTVSSFSPRPSGYRITVKLQPPEEGGRGGSAHMHDLEIGTTLDVRGPHGAFVLPRKLDRPIVMISSGIGITPMIAFAEELAWRAPKHPVWFIHGARSGATTVFARSLRALRNELPNARWHIRFSQPRSGDRPEADYQSTGRVDRALLQELLPIGSYEFYVCGPAPFIGAIVKGLRTLDVPTARIHTESFRIANDEQGDIEETEETADELPDLFPRQVRFTRSGQEAVWDPSLGTLLDFAEHVGIRAPHSCRTGMCGECSQELVSGNVIEVQATPHTPQEGHILLCSTVPLSDAEIDL